MTTLDFPGQPPVTTNSAEQIATLARKGWTIRPAPPTPGPLQAVRWDGWQWLVEMVDPAQEKARVGAMVQAWIDGVCSGGTPYFRDIFSARGYVGDPNPAYHARAVLLRDWSSSVWTYLDGVAADVLAGNRLPPTDAQLMAELPQPPELPA